MDLRLKDKVIIVTGGAKGMGAGISKILALENTIPVIVGRNEQDNKNICRTDLHAMKAHSLFLIIQKF